MSNFIIQFTACLLALFIFEITKKYKKVQEPPDLDDAVEGRRLKNLVRDYRNAIETMNQAITKIKEIVSNTNYDNFKEYSFEVEEIRTRFKSGYLEAKVRVGAIYTDPEHSKRVSDDLKNIHDSFDRQVKDFYDIVDDATIAEIPTNDLESFNKYALSLTLINADNLQPVDMRDSIENIVVQFKELYEHIMKNTNGYSERAELIKKYQRAMENVDRLEYENEPEVKISVLDMQKAVRDYEQWSEAFEYTSKRFKDLKRESVDSSDLTQARIEAEYKDVVEAFNNMNSAGECLIALQHNFFTPDIWARACTGNNISMGKMTEYMRNYRDFKGNVKVK